MLFCMGGGMADLRSSRYATNRRHSISRSGFGLLGVRQIHAA